MYRLRGRTEHGELAELYLGEDAGGAPVTIKLFHARTTDPRYARAAARHAERLARLSHPALLRVLDVGVGHGRLAVVSRPRAPWSLGLVLRRLATREVVLPPAVAVALVIDLCEALEAAHALGLVHGALTPGNVCLGGDGALTVADAGALELLAASPRLVALFGKGGRVTYRAPELATGAAATPASDVYSVAALAYELLTLKEAGVASEVRTRAARLAPPSRLARRLNPRFDGVIMRALERAPERRTPTCGELAHGLREVLSAQGGVPGRTELARFALALFPNEAVAGAPGPVPFERLELGPIEGLLEPGEPVAAPPVDRPSFSGPLDELTPTRAGLPAFAGDDRQTQPEASALSPRAKAPARKARRARIRVVDERALSAASAAEPAPEPPRRTIMTFAQPFRRASTTALHRLEQLLARSRRRARVAAFVGTLVLVGGILGATALALRTASDPVSSVVQQLPAPVARALEPHVPRPSLQRQLVERVEAERERCHRAPDGPVGFVTVATRSSVDVQIDGVTVCGSLRRVAVAPGQHAVVITERTTRRAFRATPVVGEGRTVRVAPGFK